jgi:hypothetical protein
MHWFTKMRGTGCRTHCAAQTPSRGAGLPAAMSDRQPANPRSESDGFAEQ